MIIREDIIINDNKFKKTYSDIGNYIMRDDVLYQEAIDPVGTDRQYIETDIHIEVSEESEVVSNGND